MDGNEKRQKETKSPPRGTRPSSPAHPETALGLARSRGSSNGHGEAGEEGQATAVRGLARPARALLRAPQKPGRWGRLHESHERRDTGPTGPYSVMTPDCGLAKRSPPRHTSPGTPGRYGEEATAFRPGSW